MRSPLRPFLPGRVELADAETERREPHADVDRPKRAYGSLLRNPGHPEPSPNQTAHHTGESARIARVLVRADRDIETSAHHANPRANHRCDPGPRDWARFSDGPSILRLDAGRFVERETVAIEPGNELRVARQISDASEIPRRRDSRDQ